MPPKSEDSLISRRSVVHLMMSVSALALFQQSIPSGPTRKPEGFVEVNGWILKRSEVA